MALQVPGVMSEAAILRQSIAELEGRLRVRKNLLRQLEGETAAAKPMKPPAKEAKKNAGGGKQTAAPSGPPPYPTSPYRFVDIAVNFTDGMFRGNYRGKQVHGDDTAEVFKRAEAIGVAHWMITGGSQQESEEALEASLSGGGGVALFSTVGCHPTRCDEFEKGTTTIEGLRKIIKKGRAAGKVIAIGECGLDYDRLEFCSKEVQRKWFAAQLQLAREEGLPMFLHNRSTDGDFAAMVREHRSCFDKGVAHSFTGSLEEAQELLDLGLYIGVNGCSLKTAENLEVVKGIPLERMLLETDAPWCDIRPTHAGHRYVKTEFAAVKAEKYSKGYAVKSRQEPAHIIQVFEVVMGVKGIESEEDRAAAARQLYDNAMTVFPGLAG